MEFLKKIFGSVDKLLFLWIGSIILIIITFLLLWFKIDPHQTTVILHYNVITGVDLSGGKTNLYKIPATGLFLIVVNFFIVKYINRDKGFLAFIASLVTFIMCFALLAATLLILRLN